MSKTYRPRTGWDEWTARFLKSIYLYGECWLLDTDLILSFAYELERIAGQIRKDFPVRPRCFRKTVHDDLQPDSSESENMQ